MIAVVVLGSIPVLAQFGDDGARPGSQTGGPAPVDYTAMSDVIDQGFEDVPLLEVVEGWCLQNNSSPLGLTSWSQGASSVFPAHVGDPDHYASANYNNSGSPGDISTWMTTPVLDLGGVAEWSVWTRTVAGSSWPDAAQLYVCPSTDCCGSLLGVGVEGTGDCTVLLEYINENETLGGYPEDWTQFVHSISESGQGCLAFRYYIHDSGPTGVNSNYIGVDTWQVSSTGGGDDGGTDDGGGVPATTTWGVIVLIALFLGITLFYMRRRAKA
jgi:hypothetical protein